MIIKKFGACFLLLSGLAAGAAGAQADGAPIASGAYRTIHSKALGEDRTLLVRLPEDYTRSDKKYPVVYKLDGEMNNFIQAVSAAQYLLDWMDKAPDPIIVGIANTDRNRDMVLDQRPDDFIRFLKDELIPFVDKNYRTSGFRTLCGQSASSVFAAYSFLKQPPLFDAYILSSFGLFRESVATLLANELKHVDLTNVGRKYLFVANGAHDSYDTDGSRTKRGAAFLKSLRAAAPATVSIQTKDYDDEGHVPFPAIYDGLKWIYSCEKARAQADASAQSLRPVSLTSIANLQAQEKQDTTESYLRLDGAALGEVTQHDAMMLNYHVPMLVDRLKQSGAAIPQAVSALLGAAQEANRKNDYYSAFRLYARAAGLARGAEKVESSEVAASIQLRLNRAIFSRGEKITLTLSPLFSLGHPLTGSYTVNTWLENRSGVIAGTQQQRVITELKPTSFDFSTEALSDGVTAVGYRLDCGGDKLVEFKHAVLIARDSQMRLDGLKAKFAAIHSPANGAAIETLEYQLRGLEQERSGFDGNWQRLAHPFGMYLSYLNFAVMGRPVTEFPVFTGRIRYPEDIVSAEALAGALAAGSDPILKQTGDMLQAYRATDGELVRYRIFVPKGYDPGSKYPLIVALHSGAGEGTYFEWESLQSGSASQGNNFKQLAQEKGYIVACPNGRADFLSARGEADVLSVLERVESIYSIDRDRVFLTGWSGGSSAAWRIAISHPTRFQALAPVAGAAEWLDRKSTEQAASLQVRFFGFDKDPSVSEARRTSVLAKELLPHFAYQEYADTSHDAAWSKALPAIFDFFGSASSRKASFQGLGDFPGGEFESGAQRVSADGAVVVGHGTTAAGQQAFRWTQSEGMVSLGNLPDGSFKQSSAQGVSSDGSVIVGSGDTVGSGWDTHHGFRWTKSGGMVNVGSLNGSARFEAIDVSADGAVVVGDGGQQAFRWTQGGGAVGLGTLPGRTNSRAIAVSADGSVAVGSSYNLPSWDKQEAFVWTPAGGMEGLGYLPGGNVSFPNAVSPDGSVIAGTASSPSGYPAFRWTRSTGMVSIGHLPGRQTTHPGGVSANGAIIVGGSFVDRDHATAFIWDAAHGMRSLRTVLETEYGLNLAGWTLQFASSIAPDGSVIVGWGKNPAGQQEAFRAVLGTPSASRESAADYLGQTPPGHVPVVFAPGIVSRQDVHSRLAISPDGKEMCWTSLSMLSAGGTANIKCVAREDGRWAEPQTPRFVPAGMAANPLFSPDGTKLFFDHTEEPEKGWSTRYVEKTASGWSAAKNDGFLLRTSSSFTKSGKVYFSDRLQGKPWDTGIYRAAYSAAGYTNSAVLETTVNSPYHDYTPYISPDETYLMFSSSRPSMDEKMFLYISFRDKNGAWPEPRKMNDAINFSGNARFPSISPDGKYLFFCGDDGNIYWVDIKVIEKLKKEVP